MEFAVAEDQEFTLPQLEERPLVTFALFAYNQEKFIREAVEGAFSQTYEPLEIILSDDCSTDQTFEIIKEMASFYRGPHKIILNKNPNNKKTTDHINIVFELSSGELIVMAAGDDISEPHRVKRIVETWVLHGKPSCALHSKAATIGNTKISTIMSGRATSRCYSLNDFVSDSLNTPIHGATAAYTVSLFNDFGPLSKGGLIEDRVISMRALLSDGLVFCDDVLVKYRISENNTGGLKILADKKKWGSWIAANLHSIMDSIDDYLGACSNREITFDKILLGKMLKTAHLWNLQNDLIGGNFFQQARALSTFPQAENIADKIYLAFAIYDRRNSILYKLLSKINRYLK